MPVASRLALEGLSIVVVEDDYYQAKDTQRVLQRAGATVVGPFGQSNAAVESIRTISPDCAVVDLNLGGGPSFDFVRSLKRDGVPLVIVSGYDETIMPPDLGEIVLLRKPTADALLIEAIGKLASRANR